jgi:glucose-6-phosphate 1-dehydrogenase
VRQTLLILGATGDVTERWLLPGLGGLLASGGAEGLSLIGVGLEDWDDDRWRKRVAGAFEAHGAGGARVDAVTTRTLYVRADVSDEADLRGLLGACHDPIIIYFALPPAVTERACQALTAIDVPAGTRLVMEKPFGTDAAGARALNELLARLVPEDHVYRVDHYLGMSTVLNILGLRFANRMLEPVLNAEHVEEIDVVFDESLGLEGRAGYYDGAGALIDMIQSHSLQVLSLLTMEAPSTLQARDLRDCKAQVLRATRIWRDDPVAYSRRARYTAGEIDGRHLPSYVDEPGVDPSRGTETLAEVVVAVDTWRWAGVPFRLRAGKALGTPRKEIVISFRQPRLIPRGLRGYDRPDRLRVGLDSHRLNIDLNVNGPGHPLVIDPVTLQTDLGPGDLPPYGEVLRAILDGDPVLSVRGDTAVDCWRIVEPVLRAWRDGEVALEEYVAGTRGPSGWPAASVGGSALAHDASGSPPTARMQRA